jgi:hypothetical protein
MPRLIQFEGRQISLPDDATDAEVAMALGGTGQESVPLPQPKPPQSPSTLHSLAYGAQQVGRGAATAIALPFDLAAGAQNLVTGGVNKIFGTSIPEATPASTMVDKLPFLEPQSAGEKLGGNIADYGTQALMLGGASAAAAPARAASLAAGGAPKVGDAFVRPFFTDPTRTFAGTAAGGAGSGAAINAVEDNVPEKYRGPLTDMAAAALGGIGGAGLFEGANLARRVGTAAVSKLGQVFTGAGENSLGKVDPVTLKPYSGSELDSAAARFQSGVSNPNTAARNIEENAAYYRDNNLPVPSSGLISDDIGLQSSEAGMRSKNGVPFLESDARLKNAATERVGSLRNPEADQGAVTAKAQQRADVYTDVAQRQVDQAQGQGKGIEIARQREAQPLVGTGTEQAKATASQNLDKSIVEEGYIPARTEKNRQFRENVPAETPVDTSTMAARAAEFRKSVETLPEAFQSSAADLQALDSLKDVKSMSYGDASKTRMMLSEMEKQARANGQFEKATTLGAIRQELQKVLDQANPEAAANYKENFAPTYRGAGPGSEAGKFTKQIDRDQSRSTTPPTKTAGRFLSSPEKAQELQGMIDKAQSPQAGQDAVRNYLRSDFASAALNSDGTINARRAQAWLDHNSDVLGQFPQAGGEFRNLAARARTGEALSSETQTVLKAAQDNLKTTGQSIERGAIGTLLREDPRDVARRLITGKSYAAEKELDQIHNVIGQDKAAREGWKAAVSEVLSDEVTGLTKIGETGQFKVELGKLDRVFKDKEQLLAKIYTPEEMNTLRQAHKLLEPLKNANVKAGGGSDTADKLSTWLRAIEVPIRTVKGALEGGSIMRKIRILASTLPSDRQTIDRLVTEAYFDPDVAKFLLTRNIESTNAPGSSTRIKALIAAGAGARQTGPDNQ